METNNRFWSVGSKLVVCRKFINDKLSKSEDVNRIAFYNKLKCLANCEKVTSSGELSRQVSCVVNEIKFCSIFYQFILVELIFLVKPRGGFMAKRT